VTAWCGPRLGSGASVQADATAAGEATTELRFYGIDPDTGGDHCPAVFVDEQTGDFVFQGWRVDDPQTLTEIARHSPIADGESVVRLPTRMKSIILEALNDAGSPPGRRSDRGHDDADNPSGGS
jgi:hypothetical protein